MRASLWPRTALAVMLCLAACDGRSYGNDMKWFSVSRDGDCHWNAEGHVTTGLGASVTVDSPMSECRYGGAAIKLDASPYRGRMLKVSWDTDTISGNARIMLRVDNQGKQIDKREWSIVSTRGVVSEHVYIPGSATSISLGVAIFGNSNVRVSHLIAVGEDASAEDVSLPIRTYRAAMEVIRLNALHGEAVDWAVVDSQEATLASATQWQAHKKIRLVLRMLGDGHSFLDESDRVKRLDAHQGPVEKPEFELLQDGIARITMPAYLGTDKLLIEQFVSDYRTELLRLREAGARAWIVDITKNSGGNMWPMLRALKPLFGDGRVGGVQAKNHEIDWWEIRNDEPGLSLSNDPVALIIGNDTASSGEAVAVAFQGRSRTRTFGERTAGKSTANSSYPLPDGSRLNVTTAVFIDRESKPYLSGISPQVISSPSNSTDEALDWLRGEVAHEE